MRTIVPSVLAVIAVIAVAAGCGVDQEAASAPDPSADRRPDPAAVATADDQPAGDGSDPLPADAQRITVTATDYAFEPERITVQAGATVALTLVNRGSEPHAIELHLDGSERGSERVAPGEHTTLVFQAPAAPGSYPMYCPVGDHRARGMTATLAVSQTPAGAALDPM